MPKLNQCLQGNDLAFLRMVANSWNIELTAPDAVTAIPILIEEMRKPEKIRLAFQTLPEEARAAIHALLEHEARISWAQLTRQHGELRAMGPGKRDRERPDLSPASAVEMLWYRCMIGKAFFNLPPEAQEFAYIPEELIETFSSLCNIAPVHWGRPATSEESAFPIPANDHIVDQSCDMLAALRVGFEMNQWKHFRNNWPRGLMPFLRELLYAAYLLDDQRQPVSEKMRDFLTHSRGEALGLLAKYWMRSKSLNELKFLETLNIEENIENTPHGTRQIILEILRQIPEDQWWNITSFVEAMHDREPDFQRPGGNYDSWYIRDKETDTLLHGFTSWYEVDGALLRYLITGPMHWLGFFDLASADEGDEPTAFRYSSWAPALWSEHGPEMMAEEDQKLNVRMDATITMPLLTPRWLRYQIARFCEWVELTGENHKQTYHFHATPRSLKRAVSQGLKANQFITLLERWSSSPLPEGFAHALENWEQSGTQVTLQPAMLVCFKNPEVLVALKKSDASRLILESLNDHTIRIHPNAENEITETLVKMGYLVHREE